MSVSAKRTSGAASAMPLWRRNSPSRAVRSIIASSTSGVSSYGVATWLILASMNSRPLWRAMETRL
jgi:hypothetical protein